MPQWLDAFEIRACDLATVQAGARRRRRVARHLPGQEPAREREVRDEAEAEPLADGQELRLRITAEQRVLALLGDVRRAEASGRDALRIVSGR